MKYAEACGHFATAAKLVEEDMSEKGASKALEEQLIKVCISLKGKLVLACTLSPHMATLTHVVVHTYMLYYGTSIRRSAFIAPKYFPNTVL